MHIVAVIKRHVGYSQIQQIENKDVELTDKLPKYPRGLSQIGRKINQLII
jgi:hypothetical protein